MSKLKHCTKRFSCFWDTVKKIFSINPSIYSIRYYIEEISVKENQVIIRCRYSRSFIKITLEETLSSHAIISYLPSMQSCLLGYCYAISAHHYKQAQFSEKSFFSLQMKFGRFKIISFEHRTKILTYLDSKTEQVYKENIADVAQNKLVINNMDPTQACYIGIQAGFVLRHKDLEGFTKKHSQPILKVVK